MSITKKYQDTKSNYKVTFALPLDIAPSAKNVQVLGDFNDWDTSKAQTLKAGKKEFSTTVELKPGRYEFRYLIDGLRWENDFSADNYISSPFAGINNSVLVLEAIASAKTTATKTTAAKPATAKAPKAKAVAKAAPAAKTTAPKVAKAKAETKPVAKAAVKTAPVAKTAAPKVAAKTAEAKAPKAATKPVVKAEVKKASPVAKAPKAVKAPKTSAVKADKK
ncbi:MAG: hypothetical protein IPM42_04190 [Saprospiraceae bacterium]|nr:hypothetical protein [Saprospiraceae bacterium]